MRPFDRRPLDTTGLLVPWAVGGARNASRRGRGSARCDAADPDTMIGIFHCQASGDGVHALCRRAGTQFTRAWHGRTFTTVPRPPPPSPAPPLRQHHVGAVTGGFRPQSALAHTPQGFAQMVPPTLLISTSIRPYSDSAVCSAVEAPSKVSRSAVIAIASAPLAFASSWTS